MLNMLSKLRKKRANGENGFTLIELLVVVVIIGILIAIAIPLYLNYRKGANDKSAQSDLRSAVTAMEQCNSDNSGYPLTATFTTGASSNVACTGQAINLSSGTQMAYLYSAGTGNGAASSYKIWSNNTNGSNKEYCYNSAVGGSVTSVTTTTWAADAAPC